MGLVDLDELVLRCRDSRSRAYAREAVDCYNAGAYRACITTTWIAVMLDILGKLRELELSGDGEAKALLEKFEQIRAGGEQKLKEALEFERNMLREAAAKFELLTPLEEMDLHRLQDDRNRCAHPSMQSLEDAYQPTAELARTHLRNAVEILLQREPVQGNAAFKRICDEIKSAYFPSDSAGALTHLKTGPLSRARNPLIRKLLMGLTKAYLTDAVLPGPERRRVLAGISAIVEMYRAESENVLRSKIPDVMLGVPDDRVWTLLGYFRGIGIAWDLSNDAVRSKVRSFFASLPYNDKSFAAALGNAIHVPALHESALKRLDEVDADDFAALVEQGPASMHVPRAIQLFASSSGWRTAESHFEALIIPLSGVITAAQLREVLVAVRTNNEIWDATKCPELLRRLFSATERLRTDTTKDWQELATFLSDKDRHALLLDKMKSVGIWPPS
jgi:hypothetical protein